MLSAYSEINLFFSALSRHHLHVAFWQEDAQEAACYNLADALAHLTLIALFIFNLQKHRRLRKNSDAPSCALDQPVGLGVINRGIGVFPCIPD